MQRKQRKQYLDFLINSSFQRVNRLVLSFEDSSGRRSYKRQYLPFVELKDYNFVIDGQNFFDQPVENKFITCDNTQEIADGQGDDYATGCLLDYNQFNNYCKMAATDLSKQQPLDPDLKAIQQINFTANLDRNENTTMFLIIEKAKETILDFSQGTGKVL